MAAIYSKRVYEIVCSRHGVVDHVLYRWMVPGAIREHAKAHARLAAASLVVNPPTFLDRRLRRPPVEMIAGVDRVDVAPSAPPPARRLR